MVKKLFHIADLHFRTYKRLDESEEVCKRFLEEVTEYFKEQDISYNEARIVIVGDVVHQKITISNELFALITWFFNECSKLCPVVIIAGNHDLLENNKDRLDSITPIVNAINNDNVRYYKDSICYEDDNIVWCVYSIFEENKRPDIEGAKIEFGDDKTYIGLFHAPIINAKTDIGYAFDHGAELEIFEGCDIAMLGDIHKRQVFNHKGILIAYPSSLIQQNFGETVGKHGFLLWDIETKSYTEHDVDNKQSYYQFKITSMEDIENGEEKLTNL